MNKLLQALEALAVWMEMQADNGLLYDASRRAHEQDGERLRAILIAFPAKDEDKPPQCPWCSRDGRHGRPMELQWVCHCGYRGDPEAEPTLVEKHPMTATQPEMAHEWEEIRRWVGP